MAICHFCMGEFGSEQGVKAHMKKCDLYHDDKRKKAAALGRLPKAVVISAPVQPTPPVEVQDFTAPLRDAMKAMCEAMTKQDPPQTPQQQRRTILQAAKARVIDQFGSSLGQITASLRGATKVQIERELASLPLEELPFEEVCEMAGAIRDRLYAMTFRRQAREADRLRVEAETRQKKEVETLGALLRADRRKKTLILQANHQAHAYCQEKAIIGWDHLSVLADVESRLEVFLNGDEPILEAQEIVRSVLEARYAEAEAILAAARAKATERWHEEVAAVLVLGTSLAIPLLALWYPAQTLAIISWIERTFGRTPGAEAAAPTPEASAQTPPAASAEAGPRSTRQRKNPVSPSNPEPLWGNSTGGAPGHA
jgi:hypothetical protein